VRENAAPTASCIQTWEVAAPPAAPRARLARASPRELGLPHGDGERDSFMIGEEHCGEPRPSSLFRRREMLKSGMLAPLAVSRRGARAACA